MKQIGGIVGLGLLTVTLAACQPAPERPKAAAETPLRSTEIHSSTYVAPPRTIDDLFSLLKSAAPPPEYIKRRQELADGLPPNGLKGNRLAQFYSQRAQARKELGRQQEALADAKLAVQVAKESGASWKDLENYLELYGRQNNYVGRLRDALQARLERRDVIPSADQGRAFFANMGLAYEYTPLGDFEATQKTLSDMEPVLENSRSWGDAVRKFPDRERIYYEVAGYFETQRGNYAVAEAALRTALDDALNYERIDNRSEYSQENTENVRTALAIALGHEGKFGEAEATARKSLDERLHDYGTAAIATARTLEALSQILSFEDRPRDAEKVIGLSLDIRRKAGTAPQDWAFAYGQYLLASYRVYDGRWREALDVYEQIQTALANDKEGLDLSINHNPEYALALLETGQGEQALRVINATIPYSEHLLGIKNYISARNRGFRAIIFERLGRYDEALADFQTALPILIGDQRGESTSDRVRDLHLVLKAYLHLLSQVSGPSWESRIGRPIADEAFGMADLARGQSVQRAVTLAAARLQVKDPDLADLIRQQQDTRQKVEALEMILVSIVALSPTQRDVAAIEKLNANLTDLRATETALRKTVDEKFPTYTALTAPKLPTIEQIQSALHGDEVFISTYELDDRILLWAIPHDRPARFVSSAARPKDLADAVDNLRHAVDSGATTVPEVPIFDVAMAYKLYASLLEPLKPAWQDAPELIIASDTLAALPPALLVTQSIAQPAHVAGQTPFIEYRSVPFLAKEKATTQVPSAGAFITLRTAPAGQANRRAFVGFGDPLFSIEEAQEAGTPQPPTPQAAEPTDAKKIEPVFLQRIAMRSVPDTETRHSATLANLPRLKDTAEEIRQVADMLKADPATDIFLGAAANEGQVVKMRLNDRRVVM
ncbi:MAG TPA: tetratricopeptide repeat protein, partial [Magnetospirillaceae bacterium]